MLAAIREEAASLPEASLALPTIGDDFKRGIATALEELSNLEGHIGSAIGRMQ